MNIGLRYFKTALMVLVFMVAPALTAFEPPSATAAASGLPVPIVFTSRNHIDTLDGIHVGPPVEVLGREKAVGGKLMVLHPDGRIADLTGDKLFDVSRPSVSFDGSRIVFSGVRNAKEQWHIYEIGLDGSNLRQLTFDDRKIAVLSDPSIPKQVRNSFNRYGDFSPIYLPDGRIMFSSSRYPSLSGSCGQRALNLYRMNADGSGIHRITTERAGAIDPWVLADGRVVFSHWVDNMNVPAPAGPGLRPLEVERNFSSSFWILWATPPDGSAAGRYAFTGGKFTDKGGIFQPREMPDGRLVYTYRSQGSLLGSTLASGIAVLTPGAGDGNSVAGIGDPSNLDAPHALSPAPLPDGRIVFSYTPSATVTTDGAGRTTAKFNYGLYVVDDKFREPTLVYDDPAKDELDAVAVYPRKARVLADLPGATNMTDDPTRDLGTTAILHNSNIYADLPLEFREILSPLPGSVVAVDFYDDSQTFATSSQFPLLRKQEPRFVGSMPVNPDGSFTARIPADKPIFWLLRTATGSVARSITSSPTTTFTSFVPTHDYFRPGQQAECIGCHRGHMINPDITFGGQTKTNLARLATARASSSLDTNSFSAARVNDSRLADAGGRYAWVSAGEKDKSPWVEMIWPAPVWVDEIVLYPRSDFGSQVERAALHFSDGTSISVATPLTGKGPVKVPFTEKQISWVRFQVEKSQGPSAGLAEMVVHGRSEISAPPSPPQTPRGLKATDGNILLTWARNPEPFLAGYKVYYGTSPQDYAFTLDVGNVDRYMMTGLQDGMTYYMALNAYDVAGRESPTLSAEVKAIFRAPRIESLSAAAGPTAGGTTVTVRGRNFEPGTLVLFGKDHAKVKSVTSDAIEVVTPYYKPGVVDVMVLRPDGSRAVLPASFTYMPSVEAK